MRSNSESDLFRLPHSHPDPLSHTQIHPVSLRFASSQSDSCSVTQICSASCNWSQIPPPYLTQICSDSLLFLQSHTDSLSIMQFHSDSLRFAKFHSALFRFALNTFTQIHPDSFTFVSIPSVSFRFIQKHSDSL